MYYHEQYFKSEIIIAADNTNNTFGNEQIEKISIRLASCSLSSLSISFSF